MSVRSKTQATIIESKTQLLSFLEKNGIENLPGLNIQEPWCSLLLCGKKKIETRGYDCPDARKGVLIGSVATQRSKEPKSALTGIIRIVETKRYSSVEDFSKDSALHCVTPDSVYWFNEGVEKWGWGVEVVAVLAEPLGIKNRRGIVWTQSLLF